MSKPVIGIPGNLLETTSPVSGSIVNRSFTNDTCVRSVVAGGGVPLILPVVEDPALMDPLLEVCDGLLFPGGGDVDPKYYGETPHTKLSDVNQDIDECWFRAAKYGREHGLALLGICRGEQLLNVVWGGSLYQDLDDCGTEHLKHQQTEKRHVTTHGVRVEPDTRLSRILGVSGAAVQTNSLHHQAVKEPGKGLIVSAHAEDGIIEAIESPDGQLVAVQWHPEDLIDSEPVMKGLFADLASRAAERMRARR